MTLRKSSMAHVRYASLCCCALLPAGCATVIDGSSQVIQVNTLPAQGADCILTNGRGAWSVLTPGSVNIKRSESVLQARCTKPGWRPALAYLAPTQSAESIIGTVLIWGVLESAVDASTGAGNNYPGSFLIHMKPATAPPSTAQSGTGISRRHTSVTGAIQRTLVAS